MDPAAVRLDLGDPTEAEKLLVEARSLFETLDSTVGLALTHLWLGRLRWPQADHRPACQEATRAVELARRGGAKLVEADVFIALADAETGLGQHRSSEHHLRIAMSMVAHDDFRWHRAYALVASSRLNTGRREYRQAVDQATLARAVARQGGYRPPELAALRALADAYVQSGQTMPGKRAGEEAAELETELASPAAGIDDENVLPHA
jgi:hypothetical protein